jgi:3-deoxy-D-manno-octulosonate 8-phosphate phosphatase (KDO 8-P phosphatase)
MNNESDIFKRARKVKVILMDVDGVMTRGMIVYDSNGLEIKHFNAHDGLGIKLATLSGLKTGIISARESGTIRTRAKELKMDYLYLGREKKLDAFQELQKDLNLALENFCFIGDDLPDIPVLKQVGFAVAVKNASQMTREVAHYVTERDGGEGAVREVVEIILNAQEKLDRAIVKLWQ